MIPFVANRNYVVLLLAEYLPLRGQFKPTRERKIQNKLKGAVLWYLGLEALLHI